MEKNLDNILKILSTLATFKSVSPKDDGGLDYIKTFLSDLGFDVVIKEFEDTKNLYAEIDITSLIFKDQKLSTNIYNFCFAGHIDVVPPGNNWNTDPFTLTRVGEKINFRGACDMKGAIGVFLQVLKDLIFDLKKINTNDIEFEIKQSIPIIKISCLLTSDEEAKATNGIVKMMPWLIKNNYKITHCILGEPTSIAQAGDNIKTGRRGSVNFELIVNGKQGHVAYSENAINPNAFLCAFFNDFRNNFLEDIISKNLSFEITKLSCDNNTENVVPDAASAKFNIRFTGKYNSEKIIEFIDDNLLKTKKNSISYTINNNEKDLLEYDLKHRVSAESFKQDFEDEFISFDQKQIIEEEKGKGDIYVKKINFVDIVFEAVQDLNLPKPTIINNGGTSDARFLHEYCKIIEYGFRYETAHQKNEYITCNEIEKMYNIYSAILKKFLAYKMRIWRNW